MYPRPGSLVSQLGVSKRSESHRSRRPDHENSGERALQWAVLADGIDWAWESFPEYLDALASKPRAVEVAAQLPHGALRTYAIGDDGEDG